MPEARRISLYEQLAALGDDMDALCREAAGDLRSQSRFEELEEEAQRIAAKLVAAFRGPGAAIAKPSMRPGLRIVA